MLHFPVACLLSGFGCAETHPAAFPSHALGTRELLEPSLRYRDLLHHFCVRSNDEFKLLIHSVQERRRAECVWAPPGFPPEVRRKR